MLLMVPALEERRVTRLKTPTVASLPDPPAPPVSIETLEDELARVMEEHPGDYGISISHPASGESLAMDGDQTFTAGSLGKLPTLMGLYRAADRGEVNLEDEISMLSSDVQAYGTGVLYKYRIGYTMTLRECAWHLIQESDNTAWAMLTRYLGRAKIQNEVNSAGAHSTSYWAPNATTPDDVMLMLEKISDPDYTSSELSAEMLDMMTNTDFEDRLPEPLPEGTRVAHKIGSYEDTFSDAGIVFPNGSREDAYFVVVVASGVTEAEARSAIQDISLVLCHSSVDG
jgi:beta-lactamase class A